MMNDSRAARQQNAGLCDRCVHAEIITSDRGSRFYLCKLSKTDRRFPKYPRLPVLQCEGFTKREGSDDSGVAP
jgi:hypothetical protein